MPHAKGSKPMEDKDHTEIKFHLDKPQKAYIVELAEQLQRMEDGVPTPVVYSYSMELPEEFDSANPPEELSSHPRLVHLVDRFYRLTTRRDCTVNINDEHTRQRTRCPGIARGFQDILQHQRAEHGRTCHYLCLVEDCLAPFDKVGNAKRHVNALHTSEAVSRRQKAEEETKFAMNRHLAAAQKSREFRKCKHGKINKRSPRLQISSEERKPGGNPSSCGKSLKGRMHIKHSVLGLTSRVYTDVDTGDVDMIVAPTDGTAEGEIRKFHSEHLATGKLAGNVETTEQREWVVVTGLLDISYLPAKVNYIFENQR